MKYLGKVSIAEDGNVIIGPVDPDVTVGSGTKIVICDRDGELIGVIPEDDISIGDLKECCQREKEQDRFSATCPECKTRLPRPDGIKCWLNEDQRDRLWPPGAPAIGDRYIPYLTEDTEKEEA